MSAEYKATEFPHLRGLQGISDQQIEQHLALYQGYVKNTNQLNEEIADLLHSGKASTPDYAELTRRLGFEYNGMILHEYYFGNLTSGAKAEPAAKSAVRTAVEESFGDWKTWVDDFRSVGAMRGVGWAILYQDPTTGRLTNHWITLHQDGHPAGFKPLLVMDVWEHAYMVDYKATERAKYLEAFFANINWDVVDRRITSPAAERSSAK
jgi:Fe-Mn family superoxide dismutase